MKKRLILLVSAVIMSVSFCTGCTFGNTVETAEDDQKIAEVVETAMKASSEPDVVTPYDEWTDEEVITKAIDDFYADYPELFETAFSRNDGYATCRYTNIDEVKEAALEAYRENGFPMSIPMYNWIEIPHYDLEKEITPEPNGDEYFAVYYPEWISQYGVGYLGHIEIYGRNNPSVEFNIDWGFTGEVDGNGFHLKIAKVDFYHPSFYGESKIGKEVVARESNQNTEE